MRQLEGNTKITNVNKSELNKKLKRYGKTTYVSNRIG